MALEPVTTDSLHQTVEKLRRMGKEERDRAVPAPPRPPVTKKGSSAALRQLPLWPDDRRAIPSDLLRCALFGVSVYQERRQFRDCPIASLKSREITYSGPELRQRDEDVFLQLLHCARQADLSEWIEFRSQDMIKALRWSDNARSREELRETIERLTQSLLKIKSRGEEDTKIFGGSLIRSFEVHIPNADARASRWRIKLEAEILRLFQDSQYTQVDWSQRLELTPMAKWFHGWYHSHREPYPIGVELFCQLSGSNAELKKFRERLRDAHDQLVEVGFLEAWHIDSADKVHAVRARRGKRSGELGSPNAVAEAPIAEEAAN
jgi:hypothetical protein